MVCRRDEAAVPERAVRILAPDRDLKPLARMRMEDFLDEILTLKHEQHCTNAFEILKLRVAEQLRRTSEVEPILRSSFEGTVHHLHSGNKDGLVTDRVTHAAHICLRHIAERLPGERHVDRPRHALKVCKCRTVRNLDDAILNKPRIRHEHGDCVRHIERQELQHAKRRLRRLRCKHERYIVCHIRNQPCRFLKHLVEPPHAATVPIVNLLLLDLRHGSDRLQAIDVEPIPLR